MTDEPTKPPLHCMAGYGRHRPDRPHSPRAPGDTDAVDALVRARVSGAAALARTRLRRHQRNTLLDTTELVHESYMRFVQAGRLELEDRAHFMGYAGKIMRSVIVDTVRERMAQRRGGGNARDPRQPDRRRRRGAGAEILEVHAALERLAQHDPRWCRWSSCAISAA